MSVGTGSIKRAAKANAKTEAGKSAEEKALETVKTEDQATVQAGAAEQEKSGKQPKAAGQKKTVSQLKKGTASAKRTAAKKADELSDADESQNRELQAMDEQSNAVQGGADQNDDIQSDICHLTEELPVYLL